MNLAILQLPKLIVERQSAAVFGVLIIIMLWAIVIFKYIGDVHEDRLTAERNNHNFSMVFEENVLRSIGEIDKALLYLRRTIETRNDTVDFHTVVSTTDVLSEIIVQVAIIDARGIMRASNAGPQPAPALDLSDREHYRAHLNGNNDNNDKLFISKPVVGRASGKWSVQFTRRFANKDGTLGGVVVASLDPDHFTKFYNRIDFGSSLSIALIGDDGIVRSSGGSAGNFVLGQDLGDSELFKRIKAVANGTFLDSNSETGDARLITLRSVKGQPLWVSVIQKRDEIFSESRATLQLNIMVGALLTLAILAAMERLLQTEGRARLKAQQLQLTLDHMSQGIILVTNDGQIPIINERCVKLLELPDQFIGKPPPFAKLLEYKNRGYLLSHAVHPVETYGDGLACASQHVSVSDRLMPNGSVIEVRVSTLPDGSLVETFTDITERWKAEADVARLASEDALTGLPNRRSFRSALERLSRSRRAEGDESPQAKVAVFFLDVDRFKVINDTLGHRVGDLLLQEVAKRLKSAVQPADIVARLGGDEFAIVVPSGKSRSDLEMLANAIVRTVAEPYELDGYQIRSTVSIGIAVGPQDGDTADDLLIAADLALYAVKATKRGAYRFYEPCMNAEMNERRQLEVDLREAIERNQLELHYQPILNLRHHSVVGFEALARWRKTVGSFSSLENGC
jgi:diguanylate cyclase (GGDEF)-like protein